MPTLTIEMPETVFSALQTVTLRNLVDKCVLLPQSNGMN